LYNRKIRIKLNTYQLLPQINFPTDLRLLDERKLPLLCEEIRLFMIDTITNVGGHLGAGLGVVELTVALHYVFNTPEDKIIFDVGHQGYPHKIITGRKELLHTIRQKGGISGFLRRVESEYDSFGCGHASTSISAALGMSFANDLNNSKQSNNKFIAVVGDGSLTGGLAYEGLNNAGFANKNIIVILNDNNISIDKNISAFSNYFNELFSSQRIQG
jgi:1-deoxy-D-xylulose-5-phosphate synthase